MSVAELIPILRGLSHADKLRVLQVLASELAAESGVVRLEDGGDYPVWSPYDAFEAAETLREYLARHKDSSRA